jgi:hypothetical protein
VRVAIVVRLVGEVLSVARDINKDLAVLGRPGGCVPLVAARRLHEKALTAAEANRWEDVDLLGYGCALAGLVVEGPGPQPGEEPCDSLYQVRAEGVEESTKSGGKGTGGPHACPWREACPRHELTRAAAAADIIVTNHHNLISGRVPVPVDVDGAAVERMSVLEFVMRSCPVVIVDEIDQFQSAMVDMGAHEVVLASKGSNEGSVPLALIEAERGTLPVGLDRRILPALNRARFLAEQLLNYVLDGEIWFKDRPRAPGSGWYLPGSNNRMLLKELFGITENATDVDPAIHRALNALFPNGEGSLDSAVPPHLQPVRQLCLEAVSNDTGADRLPEIKHRLAEALEPILAPERRNMVVNALLVRSWLGRLDQSLTPLVYAVTSPEARLSAARQLAETFGGVVTHAAIPYGPLGRLLFGFRVDRTDGPEPRGSLVVQAISGDPHTTTAQLGGVVALAAMGMERIVIGLSATAFFPLAARTHLHARITWSMTDAGVGAFTTMTGAVLDEVFQGIRVAGMPEGSKGPAVVDLGTRLWSQHLGPHLHLLARTQPDRARVLLVANSYKQVAAIASGIAQVADPKRLAVVMPARGASAPRATLPAGCTILTPEELESFPTNPGTDVLIAPLSRVARSLNILIPGEQRSAIASVWVCVRPVAQLNSSAEIFASVNAHATTKGSPSRDPVRVLETQRRAAFERLGKLLSSDPRFSRLARPLKAEIVAGMLVEFIQLAGRARRGDTPVELYLVDNAFHDPALASDLPGLVRYHHAILDPAQRAAMASVYGRALSSLYDFAGVAAGEQP